MEKQKPSEVIEEFLSFLDQSNIEHDDCMKIVDMCGKRNIDYLHDMEFAKDKGERNRIATKIHNNQKQRRYAKNRALELEKVALFVNDKCNKSFISALKRLLKEQKDKEKYLEGDKEYIRRAGDES
ncbi:MAG: hypothetical protein K6G30_08140 [Acetatifactor sp.]|nr:hypothetical protein [Acetatifactor sp.]